MFYNHFIIILYQYYTFVLNLMDLNILATINKITLSMGHGFSSILPASGTLHHEDHGATLKHKCGKRIVALSLLSFSLIFWAFSIFMASFLVRSLISTCWGIIVSIILSSLGQCSSNDDHHTFIYLQLKNYNSILRTKYDSM